MGLAVVIFGITMGTAMLRPGKIGIGYPALAGAALCLALGITTAGDALTVIGLVWNATLTLVAIIISSLIFDEAGFFDYAASKIAVFGSRNRFALFSMVVFLGAGVSTFFSNDGAVLILTPVVYSMLTRSGMSRKDAVPYLISLCIVSDTASNMLVVSNLTNIMTAGFFHISFLEFSERLLIPDIVAVLSTLAMLLLLFRKQIAGIREPAPAMTPDEYMDPLIIKIALPYLAVLMALYATGGMYGIPVGLIAIPASACLAILAAVRRRIDVRSAMIGAPWQIILFSLGIYIIVFGLGQQGFSSALTYVIGRIGLLPGIMPVMLSGMFFAAMAAVLNNLPSVMMANLAIAHFGAPQALIYANIAANNIGPRFTPIGSLSTLLWMSALERKSGIRISIRYFMKTGFLVGLPVLTLTLFAVALAS